MLPEFGDRERKWVEPVKDTARQSLPERVLFIRTRDSHPSHVLYCHHPDGKHPPQTGPTWIFSWRRCCSAIFLARASFLARSSRMSSSPPLPSASESSSKSSITTSSSFGWWSTPGERGDCEPMALTRPTLLSFQHSQCHAFWDVPCKGPQGVRFSQFRQTENRKKLPPPLPRPTAPFCSPGSFLLESHRSTPEVTHTHKYFDAYIHTHQESFAPNFILKLPKGKTTEKVKPLDLDLIPANDLIGINSGQELGVRHRSSPAPPMASESRCCSSADLALISF